ncbi:MAG: hypothetical protein Q8S54_04780 [Bacteroidota bacterium]|nr:hypothetical protein [Odoribacter sp.]MDP3642489.1 hypothetical protein [Bacteroidota bacterium]
MKNKFKTTVWLILVATLGYAQQNTKVSTLPAKGTLMQTGTSKESSTGDVAKGEALTATEGKKGLNAVNVRQAAKTDGRVSGSANDYSKNKQESGSTGNIQESKHAINTKGTGANNGPSK